MTLDELKAYRAKCEEVQSIIKRDCEYLQNDIDHKENCKLRNFGDFVERVMGLYQYLPSLYEMQELHCGYGKTATVNGKEVCLSFGNGFYNPYWWGYKVCWKSNTSYGTRGIYICSDGFGWKDIHDDDRRKEFQMWVSDNADELYSMLVSVTAEVNKNFNNALIKKNKELLDKAEHLKD